jgi:hypothetical protein
MNTDNPQTTSTQTNSNRLSKKSKRPQMAARGASAYFVTLTVFSKPAAGSHLKLRERTLLRHRPKLFNPFQSAAFNTVQRRHGVEITDDVFVWDAEGKRIPRIVVPVERLP